ncbi:MAG: hypothetical protein K2X34_12460 [Hyphomonadaceae bacterium]|nr:hypothetical protein [Hyphomonadaceae bacterium]
MAQISALERLKDRARQSHARVTASANGRELDIEVPQWKRPNGSTEPLSRQEREFVLRWQFLGGGASSIDSVGEDASDAANEALANAYLRVDDEIGPVLIMFGPYESKVVFGDASERALTKTEQEAVDRFLDATDTYREHLRQNALARG